jgi:hypothetical protein
LEIFLVSENCRLHTRVYFKKIKRKGGEVKMEGIRYNDISEVRQIIWGLMRIKEYVKEIKDKMITGNVPATNISTIMKMITTEIEAIRDYLLAVDKKNDVFIAFLWAIVEEIGKMALLLVIYLIMDYFNFEKKDIFSVKTINVINRLEKFLAVYC